MFELIKKYGMTDALKGHRIVGGSKFALQELETEQARRKLAWEFMALPIIELGMSANYDNYPFRKFRDIRALVSSVSTGHTYEYDFPLLVAKGYFELKNAGAASSLIHLQPLIDDDEFATQLLQQNNPTKSSHSPIIAATPELGIDTANGNGQVILYVNTDSSAIDRFINDSRIDGADAMNIIYTASLCGQQLAFAEANGIELR